MLTPIQDFLFDILDANSIDTYEIPPGVTLIPGELPFPIAIADGCVYVPTRNIDELFDVFNRSRQRETHDTEPVSLMV